MLSISQHGDFNVITNYLNHLRDIRVENVLHKYGQRGVELLAEATPLRTGITAASWSYEIVQKDGSSTLQFNNSNINKGVNIALILQYGHGTGTGGWVEGIDYINPAMEEVFKNLADEAWKEVMSIR